MVRRITRKPCIPKRQPSSRLLKRVQKRSTNHTTSNQNEKQILQLPLVCSLFYQKSTYYSSPFYGRIFNRRGILTSSINQHMQYMSHKTDTVRTEFRRTLVKLVIINNLFTATHNPAEYRFTLRYVSPKKRTFFLKR